jgi:Ca2+-binding EF-hand superfamily protein
LAKALGYASFLSLNQFSFNDLRSIYMTLNSTVKSIKRQQRKADTSLIARHFNTFSIGLITLAALHMSPVMAQMAAPAKPVEMSAKVQEAFARADKNGDGKLSKEEAAAMPAILELFDKADADKDGFLSKAEFADVAKE